MSTHELDPLHQRYVELSNRFKSAWTFHQFLQGLHKLLMDGELGQLGADFQAVYGLLKEVSQNLDAAATGRVRNELEMVERRLQELTRWLLQEDNKVSPSLLRLFLQRVRNQTDSVLLQLVKFYLYARPTVEWTQDHHDKTDFLVTRLTEESDGTARLKDPGQARQVFEGLWRMVGGDADAAAVADARGRLAALAASMRSSESFDELIDQGLIPQYRRLKLELGDLFFHPEVLMAVVEINLELRNHVQALYRRDERKIVADYQRIFELEQQVATTQELEVELATFRDEVESFEKGLQTESLSLSELGRLRERVRLLVPRLTQMREGEELFAPPPPLEPPRAKPGGAPRPESLSRDELEPFAGKLDELWEALIDVAGELDPRAAIYSPRLYGFRLDPREIEAFRRLSAAEPAADAEGERLLLWTAAVRAEAAAEAEEIRGLLDDTSITREAPVFARARRTLRIAALALARLDLTSESAVAAGALDEAQAFQGLRMRLRREHAELWLLLHRP